MQLLTKKLQALALFFYSILFATNQTPLLFLLTFTKRLTSNVFTNVTIGMGDDIHIRNASARLLSWGLISLFISFSSSRVRHLCREHRQSAAYRNSDRIWCLFPYFYFCFILSVWRCKGKNSCDICKISGIFCTILWRMDEILWLLFCGIEKRMYLCNEKVYICNLET